MRRIITEYISKKGIRFHHSISTYPANEGNKPILELSPETHYTCEVFILLSGSVKYNVEGQLFQLTPLDAILILPHQLHSMESDKSLPYERMVLHFPPDLLAPFAELRLFSTPNAFSFPTILPKKIIKQSNLLPLMEECKALCQTQDKYTDLHITGVILQIVETLDKMMASLNETNTLPPIKVNKISHACIRYINENLTRKARLTPQNMAKELHISPSHLQHTFKKELGVSLHYYVFKQKMQLAKKLLSQGYSPQVVSDMLGYEYYSTFYHNFVKHFLSPPTSFTQIDQNIWENVDKH